MIGSSVFGMPATLAALTGAWSPVACLVAGLGILALVLCFAEVASRFDGPGGPYLYAREAFGPFVGFQAGWLTFWIRVTALAANLNVFVLYLGHVLPEAASSRGRLLTMGAVAGIVTLINVIGVRQATWGVNVFTVAKLLPLGLLVLLGLPQVEGAVLATQAVADPRWAEAVLLLVFAYGGFEAPLIPASETRNPRRDAPFALLVALAVIASLYMLVQLVVVGVVPNVAKEAAPVAAAFSVLLGPAGAILAVVAALVSISGYANGTVLQSPRLLFAMADRGELPSVLARVHSRFRTPWVAILAYVIPVFALAAYGSFAWNATLSAVVRLLTYGLTAAALLVFRRRGGGEEPTFRLAGAWVIAPLAVAFCVALMFTRGFTHVGVLLAFLAVGAVLSRWGQGTHARGQAL